MMNPNPQQFGGSYQQPPPQQQKGCWGRHWKWLVPAGCLGLILAAVALAGAVVFFAMSALKSSEVYQGAVKIAQAHPAAAERLGQPIEDGWLVKGRVSFEAGSGKANFEIPLSGPKSSGTLHVSAVNGGDAWVYERLDLAAGGETVSLLDRSPVQPPPGLSADVEQDADDALDDSAEEPAAGAEDTAASDGQVISGGVLNGKAVSKPQPPYPPVAKAARASGAVTVQVTVDETGRVVSARAVSGHPLLQNAAVQAARLAKFSPTLLGGKPVKVSGVLTYNFVLE